MSKPQQEKPQKPLSWWIPLTFAAVLTWLLNNLITIATFVATGVVHLSHIGIVPFLFVLGLSVVFSAIGFILGVRLCIYIALGLIVGIFQSFMNYVERHTAKLAVSQADSSTEHTQATANPVNAPSTPPTRWERVREAASDVIGNILVWLLVPKRFR